MLDLASLARIWETHGADLKPPTRFELRGVRFDHHPQTALMGVVNRSADSWYRESVSLSTEAAIRRGKRLFADGAAIVDLGAESTVLDADRVDADGQKSALLPIIEALAGSGGIVSAETYDLSVAEACLDAGAAILNLTSAQETESFYKLAAERDAGVVICFVKGRNVRDVDDFAVTDDHASVLHDYFAREAELAAAAGVSRIWLDPGLGFYYRNLQDSAERVRYQMKTFLTSFPLCKLGWPICQALPHAFEFFEDEVRCAEPFFAVLAALGHTDLIRTHEVSRVRGVLQTMAAFES
ncbi:MAG: dihydropteroate synthase [Verrucomicrobiales bacterium]|jgi:dihydropteroate synthase